MQQGLITSYSSLIVMERFEPQALEVIKKGLSDTTAGKAFNKLRRGQCHPHAIVAYFL